MSADRTRPARAATPAGGDRRSRRADRVEWGIRDAARWAQTLLRGIDWHRQAWVCPDEPPFLAARLLAAAADERHTVVPLTGAVGGPIRRVGLFVGAFAIQRIGKLVTEGSDVRIGRAGADCELHVLFGDLGQAEGVRRRLVQTRDEGWMLYAKFIREDGGDWIFAMLAIRQPETRFMLYDQSFVRADDELRQWATHALRRGLTAATSIAASDGRVQRDAPIGISARAAIDRERPIDPHADAAMRVAFYVGSMAIVGGLERWVVSMIGALRDIGVTAIVIALSGEPVAAELSGQLKGRYRSLEGNAAALGTVLADTECDVLLLNHAYDGVDAIASRITCFEVLHNIYFWQKDDQALAQTRRRLRSIISISPVVTQYATDYLAIVRDSIIEIPHGFDPVGFVRPIGHLNRDIGSPRAMRFLQVANVYPQKNTLALVMAFHLAFPGDELHCLDIAGGLAHQPLSIAVREYIEANGLGDRIRLLGSVDRYEMSRLYARSHVFCFPSLHEGYGLAMLEAMYYALPMIVSNTGNAAQLASLGNGIVLPLAMELEQTDAQSVTDRALAPPHADVAALAEALVRMAADYSAFQAGATAVAADFSRSRAIGATARSYADVFRRALES